jgi:hypothetical protein
MMRVTFDSNVWRKVASPDNFLKDPLSKDYFALKGFINNGLIKPFLSDTIFTLEAIKRKDRKQFFKIYKPKVSSEMIQKDGVVQVVGTIAPNPELHPGNNDFLKEHLDDAIKMGFNIIGMPRFGSITNAEIERYYYTLKGKESEYYYEWIYKAGEHIRSLHAGEYWIEQIGLKYSKGWFVGIGLAPDSENDNIATAIAEWADGDSVAAHIAIQGDCFCTLDSAKRAGENSIFSPANMLILENDYNFKKVTPTDLVKLIKNNGC